MNLPPIPLVKVAVERFVPRPHAPVLVCNFFHAPRPVIITVAILGLN